MINWGFLIGDQGNQGEGTDISVMEEEGSESEEQADDGT